MASGGARKRTAVTVEEKCLMVEWASKGTSQKEIQRKMLVEKGKDVSTSCISNVWRHKDRYQGQGNLNAKRVRKAKWPGLEQALVQWLDQVRAATDLTVSACTGLRHGLLGCALVLYLHCFLFEYLNTTGASNLRCCKRTVLSCAAQVLSLPSRPSLCSNEPWAATSAMSCC